MVAWSDSECIMARPWPRPPRALPEHYGSQLVEHGWYAAIQAPPLIGNRQQLCMVCRAAYADVAAARLEMAKYYRQVLIKGMLLKRGRSTGAFQERFVVRGRPPSLLHAPWRVLGTTCYVLGTGRRLDSKRSERVPAGYVQS
jgi:hypothetical protein